jgi:hypothetical protein
MKQWLIMIGAVLIGLVVGLAILVPTLNNDDGSGGDDGGDDWWDDLTGGDKSGSTKCTATCTMYVQEVGSSVYYTANVSAEGASMSEAMMLSFGQGIRTAEMQPMQHYAGGGGDSPVPTDTSALYKDKAYKIWGTVSFKITGSDMKSIDGATVEIYGKAGAASSSNTPDHAQGTDALYCSCGATKVTKVLSGLTDGTTYTADSSGSKFDQVSTDSGKITLTGDRVDGTVLTVYITAHGTDNSGKTITASAMASMMFKVPSYGSGALSVAITSLTGSN